VALDGTSLARVPAPAARLWQAVWAMRFQGFGKASPWALLGLFFGVQVYLIQRYLGAPIPLGSALATGLVEWALWGGLAIPIAALARSFPIDEARLPGNLLLHLAASVAVASSSIFATVAALDVLGLWGSEKGSSYFWRRAEYLHVVRFHWNVLVYWALLGLVHARDYYRRLSDRQVQAARLERALTQAQLDALRAQLEPHFLFNTLNSVVSFLRRDPDRAEQMLTRLGELLRALLGAGAVQEVALRRELELLGAYLEIEGMRFQDRLRVEYEVAPETLDALVPAFALQPLVENAVEHGIGGRFGPGVVTIAARRDGAALVLEVRDTGPGFPPGASRPAGVGLANTRERLAWLYGERGLLLPQNAALGGACVSVRIPFRTGDVAAAAEH
jgi:signal transduction histidine kinase